MTEYNFFEQVLASPVKNKLNIFGKESQFTPLVEMYQ